jgi:hypothetical protein
MQPPLADINHKDLARSREVVRITPRILDKIPSLTLSETRSCVVEESAWRD